MQYLNRVENPRLLKQQLGQDHYSLWLKAVVLLLDELLRHGHRLHGDAFCVDKCDFVLSPALRWVVREYLDNNVDLVGLYPEVYELLESEEAVSVGIETELS